MVAVVVSEQGLHLRFDTDITFVDYAVDIVNDLLAYQGLRDRTNLLVVCRELLKNAVVHGNRNDVSKAVTFRLQRVADAKYRLEVEDDGGGFDEQTLRPRTSGAPGGRRCGGLALISALAAEVVISEKGNRVMVVVDL